MSNLASMPPIRIAEARLAAEIETAAFQLNSLARMPVVAILGSDKTSVGLAIRDALMVSPEMRAYNSLAETLVP